MNTQSVKHKLEVGTIVIEEQRKNGKMVDTEWTVTARNIQMVKLQNSKGVQKIAKIFSGMDENPITHKEELYEWVQCFKEGGYIK